MRGSSLVDEPAMPDDWSHDIEVLGSKIDAEGAPVAAIEIYSL